MILLHDLLFYVPLNSIIKAIKKCMYCLDILNRLWADDLLQYPITQSYGVLVEPDSKHTDLERPFLLMNIGFAMFVFCCSTWIRMLIITERQTKQCEIEWRHIYSYIYLHGVNIKAVIFSQYWIRILLLSLGTRTQSVIMSL